MTVRTLIILIAALCCARIASAQGQGPWNNALMIAFSDNGIRFDPPQVFQDSSGVPSVAMDAEGNLIVAFQWFPAPMNGPHWDSVAVKFSSDNGATWSQPKPIVVTGVPAGYQRPFDPAITVTEGGRYRIYFSCGPRPQQPGLDGLINTYSAISDDGVNYTFEPDARFDDSTKPVIDPTVLFFNGMWQYIAPRGAPQDGAFHAVSSDGVNFTPLANIPSDNAHNWTGNLCFDGVGMRFYGGSPNGVWWSSSADGNSWGPYVTTNIKGGDPAAIRLRSGGYMIIYVGPPGASGVGESSGWRTRGLSLW